MDNDKVAPLVAALKEVQQILQPPGSPVASSGHDILNSLHTVLCSIEMLEMEITSSQREVFDRLELGAKQLDELLQAFISETGKTKSAALAKLNSALQPH